MELRQRGNRSNNNLQMETFQILEKPSDANDDEAMKNQRCLSAVPTLFVILAAGSILNAFVYYMDNRLPDIIESNSNDNDFVAKRAMSTLIKLAAIGPRPVGSYENEVLAFGLLKTEIEGIMNDTGNVNNIDMLNQNVSGAFVLNNSNFQYVLSYEDLQNVVVKVDPKRGRSAAILLNCHFDTVPAGPGVSDDGVNCAVMMEVLRVLAKSSRLRRPVIFLFNGGEEIILQASHGFVTQHPWARNARHVVNLDSCGAGGRETLFQSTESDSFLVDLYAHSVPHPYGQVIGEELFQSGIIPSDTDFRIFRDFGNMSGLDMAHYKNGYVYHTRYDDMDRVRPSVLQNTGDNLLELSVALSTYYEKPRLRQLQLASHTHKYVFFDVLGVYMFSYTELSSALAHFVIVLLSLFSVLLSLKWTATGMNRREYGTYMLWTCFACPCCTVALAMLSCACLASMLDLLGRSMSWYGNKANLVAYFATASLVVLSAAVFQPRAVSRTTVQWTVSALIGVQLFWTVALFVATMTGLRSGYLFAIMVLFPAVTGCALGVVGADRTPRLWIATYVASLIAPITFAFYLTQMFMSLFVPIAGRFGPRVNPDYIVGGLMSLSAYATIGHLAPVVALVKNPRTLLAAVAAVAVASAVAAVSPLGFPYSDGDGASMPTLQRFDVIHTRRTFYNFDGTARRNDTGYAIINWDRRSRDTAAEYVPQMAGAVVDAGCEAELLCGSPIAGQLALHSSWLPRDTASRKWPTDACDARMVAIASGDLRRIMRFNVTGPERINVYVSPYPGTRLVSWSFTPGRPEPSTVWMGHDVHVIRRSRGGLDNRAWSFWLEHESSHGFDEKTINVTVVYNWVIHERLRPSLDPEFETFIDSFPSWTHVNHAVARVDAFVY